MGGNILISMLQRVSDAGGVMEWAAPLDKTQWMDESSLLMACEEGDEPLVELSDTLVTVVDSGVPLGLLKHARVKLLQAGRELLTLYGP